MTSRNWPPQDQGRTTSATPARLERACHNGGSQRPGKCSERWEGGEARKKGRGHGRQRFEPRIGFYSESNMEISWSGGLAEEGRSTETALDEVGKIDCREVRRSGRCLLKLSWVRDSGGSWHGWRRNKEWMDSGSIMEIEPWRLADKCHSPLLT